MKHRKLILVNLWMKRGRTLVSALQQPLCLMKRKSPARGAEVDPRSQHFNGRCLHLIRPPTGRTPLLPLWPGRQQDLGGSKRPQETTTEVEGSDGCDRRSRRTQSGARAENKQSGLRRRRPAQSASRQFYHLCKRSGEQRYWPRCRLAATTRGALERNRPRFSDIQSRFAEKVGTELF